MKPLLDVNGVKQLYLKGIEHAKKNYNNPFSSKLEELCEFQKKVIQESLDIDRIMNAIWIPNPVFENSFFDAKAMCTGCELQYTPVQFGHGNTGWYFVYAIAGDYAYNFSAFRVEIAPPDVVDFDRSEAVRWIVLGGYGKVGGEWYSLQPKWLYLKYTEPSYSTFSLEGSNQETSFYFGSSVPMQFDLRLEYTDMKGNKQKLISSLRGNTAPSANFPGAYGGFLGTASMYYSYTDVDISLSINDGKMQTGKGWIDHQLAKSGLPNTFYKKALKGALSALSENKSRGWLWFGVQDFESGLQYMFLHFFNPSKTYSEDVQKNQPLELHMINVYKKGVPYFFPTQSEMDAKNAKIVMTATTPYNGVELPISYDITLPGGKEVKLAIACKELNIYPVPHACYESPAFLYDKSGKYIIGIGLIEANWYLPYEVISQRYNTYTGQTQDANLSVIKTGLAPPQTFWQKTYSMLVVLYPLWLLIILGTFILHKKEDRKLRLILSIILVLIITAILMM